MGLLEILLVIFLSLFVIGVIVKSVMDKVKGKCSCDCCNGNCACCQKYKKKIKA